MAYMRTAMWPFLLVFLLGILWAQDKVYICPMDPDVRSNQPGKCRRCGMEMRAGIPDPVEFHMDLALTPRVVRPNQSAELKFTVRDPWKDRPVKTFQIVHEKLFHMFVVSQDLQFFVHDHPVLQPDGDFTYQIEFPKPGMYRVLGDFYPDGATPQLIAKTVIIPGTPPAPAVLPRDYSTKQAENLQVAIRTDPPQPIATQPTQVYFTLSPADGIEKYIGVWAHMLAASDDLIDLIHTHPFIADGGPNLEFVLNFPRARTYRIWVQFQRKGVVNTAHFDVPVKELE
jgi:Heavy metal binding domain